MATDGFGLELNGTAPVCEVAFVEFAVVEFVAVEDKFLLDESFIFKDGHYDLTIRRAESASLAGADLRLAALDSSIHRGPQRDCSHIVHAVYDRAGFHYPYASSSDLYVGTHEFQRVTHPQGGDLVVWRGHVGIVVNPAQHVFFSALRSGLGIDTYDAPYWRERGQVRFYRYLKGTWANTRGIVSTKIR